MPATVTAPAKSFALEDVQKWLTERLATGAKVAPQEIDANQTFAQYGLDSMQVARFAGDLEDWVGRELEPTLVYDYPNIDALSRHLAAMLNPA
jgi:acyl carrier protein